MQLTCSKPLDSPTPHPYHPYLSGDQGMHRASSSQIRVRVKPAIVVTHARATLSQMLVFAKSTCWFPPMQDWQMLSPVPLAMAACPPGTLPQDELTRSGPGGAHHRGLPQ
jgi:hypothetical protein